jgi:hypothetical protein
MAARIPQAESENNENLAGFEIDKSSAGAGAGAYEDLDSLLSRLRFCLRLYCLSASTTFTRECLRGAAQSSERESIGL